MGAYRNESNMKQSGWRRGTLAVAAAIVAAIAIKAFLLFVAIPYLQGMSPTTYQAEMFPDWYDRIAMNLVEGNGYRFYPDTTATMLRTPGWVIVLAGIFSVFGHSLAATKVFNLIFSFATACLVFVLGKRVTKSNRLGLLAATITFLHPGILIADSRGGAESFLTLSLVAFILLIYRALETEATKDYLIAGFALGVVLIIKSTAALFPPFLFLYLIALRPSFERARHAAVRVGAVALAAGVVLSPWIVRNYALSGEFVPAMSVGGKAAFEGLYIVTHFHTGREHYVLVEEAAAEQNLIANQMGLKFKPGYFPQFYNISDELKFYGHLGDIVKRQYAEQPSLLLDAIEFNSRGFWVQGRTAKATTLNMILVLPFLALAIWGTYAGWRQSLTVGPILLFVGSFFAAHVAIIGQARYHVPLIPLLAILACIPLRPLIGDAPGRIKQPSGR
jgi:4-amino-4-deoxy-L-arabinose transferase-like glycosyltransferase